MQNDRRGGRPDDDAARHADRLRRAEDELEQTRVALEDARAEAVALATERDARAAELLRRTAQLREVEGRLRAREDAAALAQATLRALAPGRNAGDASEAEALRSALEEVQVLAEELGEANAALQRSNDELDRTITRRTAALTEANARLRRAEERHRLILESATDYAIFTTDAAGRVTSWNAGAGNILGWGAEEAIGMDAAETFTPEDRAAGAPAEERRRALSDGRAANERWHLRRDGSRFWADGLMMPLRGEDGADTGGFLKVLRDQTERRRAEERQALLLGELNHRVKNTLALVLAIVDQTWRGAAGARDGGGGSGAEDGAAAHAFHDALRVRLRALARAHDLLVRGDWDGADLASVVATAAAAHGGEARGAGGAAAAAIRASGPPVRLASEAAVALAMALHELATNAAKYGALSVPGGRVDVAWRVAAGEGALELSWTEGGGPPIEAPPTRRGFGSAMLERGLGRQLGGEVSLEFAREGLRCRVRLPLSERVVLR